MLVQEARTQSDNFDAVVTVVKSVLDCVDLEPAPQPDGRWQHPKVQGGVGELQNLQPRCHYDRRYSRSRGGSIPLPNHRHSVDRGGYAEGLSDAETQQLEDEVEDATKNLASDIDLFGEMDGNGGAQ